MANQVIPYEPTWLDRHFRRDYGKLHPKDQDAFQEKLARLISCLQKCRHPTTDPDLAEFRPTPYGGVANIEGGQLVEYRLIKLQRAIACYFAEAETVLLVGVTLTHDHERLKRLIKQNRGDIQEHPGHS